MCLSDEYLRRYQTYLVAQGLHSHPSGNKLRDVEDRFSDGGHEFSFNREILYSFDVCGHCEAHAILLAVKYDLGSLTKDNNIQSAAVLKNLPAKYTSSYVQLFKCPKPIN